MPIANAQTALFRNLMTVLLIRVATRTTSRDEPSDNQRLDEFLEQGPCHAKSPQKCRECAGRCVSRAPHAVSARAPLSACSGQRSERGALAFGPSQLHRS